MLRDCTFQIGQLATPFPAQILKQKLESEGVLFRTSAIENYDGSGAASEIFFVTHKDAEIAITFIQEVEREDAISEEKNMHPLLKNLHYIALIGFVGLLIYQALKIFLEN